MGWVALPCVLPLAAALSGGFWVAAEHGKAARPISYRGEFKRALATPP